MIVNGGSEDISEGVKNGLEGFGSNFLECIQVFFPGDLEGDAFALLSVHWGSYLPADSADFRRSMPVYSFYLR
jgi:hypothetical protein